MRYISLFSGIEAASLAFKSLGWQAVAFSEIEPFPCAVLKHHYPEVPNLGDITKVDWSQYTGTADLVCGGSPCQSFSIAGLRKGMNDERGNLAVAFIRAVLAIKPKWILYENVPGMLSDRGNAFGCFLAGLSGADTPLLPGTRNGKWAKSGIVSGEGYGLAWRVLNAEYFGVPQSRNRIFVVGYLGNWKPAAKILFEPEVLRGDIAEGGRKEKKTAGKAGSGIAGYRWQNETAGIIPTDTLSTIRSNGTTTDERTCAALIMATGQGGAEIMEGWVPALNCNHEAPIVFENHGQDSRIKEVKTLPQINAKAGTGGGNLPLVMVFKQWPEGDIIQSENAYNISTTQNASGANTAKILQGASVRRLTPLEVERAQGFPDNWTRIPYRGKPADKCPDNGRYKSVGNSWAVPVAAWIARRIDEVEGA